MGRAAAVARTAACAAVSVAALLFGAADGSRAAEAAPSGVAALRICTDCAASGGDLSRYGYVVLNAWDHGRIADLKARNPNLKVLVYKDVAATVAYACQNGVDQALLPAGVGYCTAAASHPEWFLTDTNGNRIEFCDYPGAWQMDVGSSSYQDAWLGAVATELARYGWDGVLMDDVNSTERFHLCGRTISKYPTDADYEAATRSFLARVGPGLTSRGFLALPNINFDCWEACWSSFIQHTSGAMREWWTKNTTGSGGHYAGNGWDWANGFLRLTQQQGKIFLAVTYAPADDVRSMRYARASFLLDWNGGASALIFEPGATDPWSPEWTADVGAPLAPRYQVGVAWRRDFSGGTVIVNPSPSTTQSVDLGGSFVAPGGATVTSVSVAPQSGLVLSRAAAPAPAPAPATTSAPAPTTAPTPAPAPAPTSAPAPISAPAPSPTPEPTTTTTTPEPTTTKPKRSKRLLTVTRTRVVTLSLRRDRLSGLVRMGALQKLEGAATTPRPVVALYAKSAAKWRTFSFVRARPNGRFRVSRRLTARRATFRAVVIYRGVKVRSGVLRVRRR